MLQFLRKVWDWLKGTPYEYLCPSCNTVLQTHDLEVLMEHHLCNICTQKKNQEGYKHTVASMVHPSSKGSTYKSKVHTPVKRTPVNRHK